MRACRQLTPVLEAAVEATEGAVELVKVDVDANPHVSLRFRVQGIPAVKAFRDGRLVDEFTGAVPRASVDSFLRGLLPSEADRLVELGDEASIRRALELEPDHPAARAALTRLESAGDPALVPGLSRARRGRDRARAGAPARRARRRRRRPSRQDPAGHGRRLRRPRAGPPALGEYRRRLAAALY